jgi:hypothetical protein
MITLVLLSILALCLAFLPAYIILPGFIARCAATACGRSPASSPGLLARRG